MSGEPDKEATTPQPHILLVEDENQPFQDFLEVHHYQVTRVNNGQEALDLLQSGFKPDLILTDFQMPQKDGIQLVKGIRQKLPELQTTPIILHSNRDRHQIHLSPEEEATLNLHIRRKTDFTDTTLTEINQLLRPSPQP